MFQSSRIVFIEGVVPASVNLFIKLMNDYFRTEGEYERIVSIARYADMPPRKRKTSRDFAYNSPERSKKEIDYWRLIRTHGLPFSFRSIDLSYGSPESRVFLDKLGAGILPEGTNIAAELLQAQNDYDNVIQEMKNTHELLVCARGPMSYYVDIIKSGNRPDILAPFENFMTGIGQGVNPVWILQCSAEQTKAMHKAATGEDKPVSFFEEQQQFYQDAANSGIWPNVSFIDISSNDPDTYRAIFASLAFQMKK